MTFNLTKIRSLFPVTRKRVFMDHAAVSPCSTRVRDAIERYLDERMEMKEDWAHFRAEAMAGKESFARLIGATIDEIAFVTNTSEGLSAVATGLPIRDGQNIVTTDLEFPSNVYPWLNLSRFKKVSVRYVKSRDGAVSLEDFENCVDDETAVVAVSHVFFRNGFCNDLKALSELAHRHGAYLVIDAAQSIGALKISVRDDDIDFLATCGYKWLMASLGTGFLYVKRSLIKECNPQYVGWASTSKDLADNFEIMRFEYSDDASRFEVGNISIIGFVGLRAAVDLLLEVGPERVEQNVAHISSYLIDRLKDIGAKIQTPTNSTRRSGIVNFMIKNPDSMMQKLRSKGFSLTWRGAYWGLRASPHFYNTEEEVDRLVREIANEL